MFYLKAGDNLEVLPTLPANYFHACVTDPPYGFKFMGQKWDYKVPSVEQWREVLRVLKPGAHLLAFGGPRTFHRVAVNIEDAGFELRDQIAWIFGTGFPKSVNISDRLNALEEYEASLAFDGWGSALKPAHEPIIVARKPLTGTLGANVAHHGTGGINIGACRVGMGPGGWQGSGRDKDGTNVDFLNYSTDEGDPRPKTGRHPANLIHDGSPEALQIFPQSSSGSMGPTVRGTRQANTFGVMPAKTTGTYSGSKGSAARFFYCAKASKEDRDEGLHNLPAKTPGECTHRQEGTAGLDTPRAGAGRTSGAKNHHPTVKPVNLMRYLCKLITPPGGYILDPFMGSGSTGKGAMLEGFHFYGIERDPEFVEISRRRCAHALAQHSATERPPDLPVGQLSLEVGDNE